MIICKLYIPHLSVLGARDVKIQNEIRRNAQDWAGLTTNLAD